MPSKLATITETRAAHLKAQGAAIAKARANVGLSQPAASAALGIPLWTYRSWEHGRRMAPAAIRRRVVAEWGGDAGVLGPAGDRCACCGRPW